MIWYSGGFATVVLATDIHTNVRYAMKIMEKVTKKNPQVMNEMTIMKKLFHKNIIRLYDVFESGGKLYMQLE